MGPKRTLVYHLHINLGHTNNKYGENKVALLHKDIWRSMGALGGQMLPYTCHDFTPKLEIMSDGMLLEGEELRNGI